MMQPQRIRYTIADIADIIGAHAVVGSEAEPQSIIELLLTDSRSVSIGECTAFFALVTPHGNGHSYIDQLYQQGVHCFVVEQLPNACEQYTRACFLCVTNTLQALQALATYHRSQLDTPVIGITGSNGKTIVKEWLYQLMSGWRRVARSPRSYNSQIGVPLSVWLLGASAEIGVIEAGISQRGEMAVLAPIVAPTIGVITTIGDAHQEYFESETQKCLEKLRLFASSKVIVYHADDTRISQCIAQANLPAKRLGWSFTDSNALLWIHTCRKEVTNTFIAYSYIGFEGEFQLPFTDDASIQNAIHCLAVCLYLRMPQQKIANQMQRLEPVAMRLEVMQGVRGCTVINDSYNSDYHSLDIALDFMARRAQNKRKVLVMSDMLQSGEPAQHLYQRVAHLVKLRGINEVIAVGPDLAAHTAAFAPLPTSAYTSTEALRQSRYLETLSDAVVLLKGARPFAFDTLADLLLYKVHETTLEVNLSALERNYNHYRSLLPEAVRLMCMVKANAYGAGAVEVSKTLQEHHVDYLAVAVADEGVELRKAGITTNIVVMNPERSAFRTLFTYGLQCEVYSFDLLEALIEAAEREGITHFPIHIKLDTGMSRLGFLPDSDIPALIQRLHTQQALSVRSVFSHLAGSDSAEHDAFTAQQYARFKHGADQLCAAFSHPIVRHICNSAAIERFPNMHEDMCRLGLGLYGISPVTGQMLHPVMTLRTTLLQIHALSAGESVGYSRRTIVQRDTRIAVLPIGYADGLNRLLSNGKGHCLVHGQPAPYLGNICMDVCMIDVTDIDCQVGDTAIIFGEELTPTAMAETLQTIPYEILTRVSERVKRVYYRE